MLGEASLRFANNEKEDAIRLCLEVIREVGVFFSQICMALVIYFTMWFCKDPSFPEPFRALSGFYSVYGDRAKSFQLAFCAALIDNPQNAKEWVDLAEVFQML